MENSEKGCSRRRCRVVWEKEVKILWYVIQTKSGLEKKCMQQCIQYINKKDYVEIFVPQYIGKKHFKKEWHDVKKVLFPGYIFVDTKEPEPIVEGLKKVNQYTKVLRDGDVISPITEKEQEFLSMMMDDKHIVQYSEGFLIGQEVCIISGPLQKCHGWIKKIDRHRRTAQMDVPMFGRRTPVEVGFGAIARISEDEFEQMKNENAKKYEEETKLQKNMVKILTGVFDGMTGKFLYADPDKDEWTVELELFGVLNKVIFKKEEIRML